MITEERSNSESGAVFRMERMFVRMESVDPRASAIFSWPCSALENCASLGVKNGRNRKKSDVILAKIHKKQ